MNEAVTIVQKDVDGVWKDWTDYDVYGNSAKALSEKGAFRLKIESGVDREVWITVGYLSDWIVKSNLH